MSPSIRSPLVSIELLIESRRDHLVLVQRGSPPYGWALPGGFVEHGEPLWLAAVRRTKEQTSLQVDLVDQFYCYSDPMRDPRGHVVSTVYIAQLQDAHQQEIFTAERFVRGRTNFPLVKEFSIAALPPLMFDHQDIVQDYRQWKKTGERPQPIRRHSVLKLAV